MDIIPKQVLDLAAKYIGYKEKASNKDLYSFDANTYAPDVYGWEVVA